MTEHLIHQNEFLAYMWLLLYLLSEAKGARGCEGLSCQMELNHHSTRQD